MANNQPADKWGINAEYLTVASYNQRLRVVAGKEPPSKGQEDWGVSQKGAELNIPINFARQLSQMRKYPQTIAICIAFEKALW